mmetsp:Transcript_134895/g.430759  ORF Transcript_134895/g.430759 Transcript_134895/m.430759 type:complete len:273 (+) Transcript_134895:329-1147(+)
MTGSQIVAEFVGEGDDGGIRLQLRHRHGLGCAHRVAKRCPDDPLPAAASCEQVPSSTERPGIRGQRVQLGAHEGTRGHLRVIRAIACEGRRSGFRGLEDTELGDLEPDVHLLFVDERCLGHSGHNFRPQALSVQIPSRFVGDDAHRKHMCATVSFITTRPPLIHVPTRGSHGKLGTSPATIRGLCRGISQVAGRGHNSACHSGATIRRHNQGCNEADEPATKRTQGNGLILHLCMEAQDLPSVLKEPRKRTIFVTINGSPLVFDARDECANP